MNGFLLVNKPAGITTYDIIRQLKKLIGKCKIGHSGTLDPFATGVVIIGIGREYTRQLHEIQKYDKTYAATVALGAQTDTYDIDGKTTYTHDQEFILNDTIIVETINQFKGSIEQTPPAYSAKKINGTRAYKLARQGAEVELKKSTITIHDIALNGFKNPPESTLDLTVRCSSGTYIRSLAFDIGKKLAVGGYLATLDRTAIGPVNKSNTVNLDALTTDNIEHYLVPELPA